MRPTDRGDPRPAPAGARRPPRPAATTDRAGADVGSVGAGGGHGAQAHPQGGAARGVEASNRGAGPAGGGGGPTATDGSRLDPYPGHRASSGGPGRPTGTEPVAVSSAALSDVRARLAAGPRAPTAADVANVLRDVIGPLGADPEATRRALTAELLGAGPLEDLLADPSVTDVLVNRPDEVWVDRGRGLERAAVRFADEDAVRRLAVRLAASGGRRLDAAAPFTDARLPDGTRLHAVLTPIAVDGTCLSLRRPRRDQLTLDDLVALGTVGPALADGLRAVAAARLAVVITGGTGTGKTTVLAALLDLVDPAERVVLVEDTTELVLRRRNLVRVQGRPANVEGAGSVTQRDLVRQALRMRPDRLVLGEVRGAEVLDLLVAFNTGHEGGMTTVHANTPAALPARLEALGSLAGLSRPAVHSHLAAALHVSVHLRRGTDGRRQVAALSVLRQGSDGLVRVHPALVATPPTGRPGAGSPVLPAEGLPWLRELLRDRGMALTVPAGPL